MAEHALAHLTVIDLTHNVAGPYCTKLFAGFGAEVIKIERPKTGDPMRSRGPFYKGEAGLERSIPFLWLNTGKKSITLNLKSNQGVEILKKLIRGADIVIENFAPGVMSGLELGYEDLQALKSDLIMTSISNFGQTGPYRNYAAEEITTYAMSGQMALTGDPEKEPLCGGPDINQNTAGLNAYIGTLLALYYREFTGEGQHIDISIHEGGINHIEIAMTNFLHLGVCARRSKHMMVPWRNFTCKDGYATVICAPFRRWTKGAELFEEPQLLQEKFKHIRGRCENRDEVEGFLQPWIDKHKKKEIFEAGQKRGLAFGYLATFEEALNLSPHRSRGFFIETDHPEVGRHEYCGAPFKLSETPWQQRRAPLLGEHVDEVLGERLGYSSRELKVLHEEEVI